MAGNWTVGTGATFSSEFTPYAARAASTFIANTVPDGTLDFTLHDGLATGALNGSFAAGNWTFQFAVVSTVQSGAADGQVVFRVIRADADGANATEITSAQQSASVCTNVAGTDINGTATISLPAFTITNQYLFIQLAWKRTGAGGMTTTNIALRTGSSTTVGTTILSSDFTPSNQAVSGVSIASGSAVYADGSFTCADTSTNAAALNFAGVATGQTISGHAGPLTYVALWLEKSIAIGTDTLYIELRSGSWTGTLLATSASIGNADIPLTPDAAWVFFNFSSPPVLSAGTTYYIKVFRAANTSGIVVQYRNADNSLYLEGTGLSSTGSSNAWDWKFKLGLPALALTVAPVPTLPTAGPTGSPILDDFNRADEDPIGLPWGVAGSGVALPRLTANALDSSPTNVWYSAKYPTAFSGDCEIFVAIKQWNSGTIQQFALALGDTGGSGNWYELTVVAAIGPPWTMRLNAIVGGSQTTLGTDTSIGNTPGGLAIRRAGTQITTYYWNGSAWTLIHNVTHTTLQMALPAVLQFRPSAIVDNFGGAGSAPPPQTGVATAASTAWTAITPTGIPGTITGLATSATTAWTSDTATVLILGPTGSPILDRFNRANEAPIASPWVTGWSAPALSIISQQLSRSAGDFDNSASWWGATPFAGNFEVFVRIVRGPRFNMGEDVVFYVSPALGDVLGAWNQNNYQIRLSHNSSGVHISMQKTVSGTGSGLGSVDLASVPEALAFRRSGSTIAAWAYQAGAWSSAMSVTDTNHTGPLYVGISIYAVDASPCILDDFGGAEDFVAPIYGPTGSPVIDNFNRADESPIAAPWRQSPNRNALNISGNTLIGGPMGAPSGAFYTKGFYGDCESFILITTMGSEGDEIELEMATNYNQIALWNSYVVRIRRNYSAAGYRLVFLKEVNGVFAPTLGDTTYPTQPEGIGFRRAGTTVMSYIRYAGAWTLVHSVTSLDFVGSILFGGVNSYRGGAHSVMDNFGGAGEPMTLPSPFLRPRYAKRRKPLKRRF